MRGMKMGLARGAVFLGALLGASTSAIAAAGATYTDVQFLASPITYSRLSDRKPLTTYVGYTATVKNLSGNTINNVTFQGTATVADPNEKLEFSSADGIACTASPLGPSNSVTISCFIGQLKAGVSTPTFTVFFRAPEQSLAPIPADYIDFRGRTVTAEGPDAGSSPNDSVDYWPKDNPDTAATEAFATCAGNPLDPDLPQTGTHDCVKVALGTPDISKVRSAVPKNGGTFFTGKNGVPGYPFPAPTPTDPFATEIDPFTTSVTVPTSGKITKATVDETQYSCANAAFKFCQSSDLSVVDTADVTAQFSPYLTIVLRMDSSNIVASPAPKIGTIGIYYTGETLAGVTVTNWPVGDCANATSPRADGLPCIASKKYYNTVKKDEDPALRGDYEWSLISLKNGRFGIE
jgi:hypothetical protein